jgi:DNA replication protein DnaC
MDTPSTTCPVCGGTGFQIVDAQDAKGRKIQKASKCNCSIRSAVDLLIEKARIPKRYEHCSFESYHAEFDGAHPSLREALRISTQFVSNYILNRENTGLLFTGGLGIGKTHLAVAILRALISEFRVPCRFYDYRELLTDIKNSYNPEVRETELGILGPVFDCEVLVIDELGAIRPSEWVFDTVSQLLNKRYNDKKTTIVTTNFPDEPAGSVGDAQFSKAARAAHRDTLGDRITDRMRSRLHEMCKTVNMNGNDFRMSVKRARFE